MTKKYVFNFISSKTKYQADEDAVSLEVVGCKSKIGLLD